MTDAAERLGRDDPRRCRAEHPTNVTVVPCRLTVGHSGYHWSSTGCAGSHMQWSADRPAAELLAGLDRERIYTRAYWLGVEAALWTFPFSRHRRRLRQDALMRCEASASQYYAALRASQGGQTDA